MALEAGNYNVTVFDDNLCQQSLSFLITEPSEFSVELTSTVPDCNDPNSGSIATEVVGYSGPIELDWGGADPDMVAAGEYTVVATDTSGCSRWLLSLWIRGHSGRVGVERKRQRGQGDSAAYYYEYTLGSNYTWTYTGAEEQQVFNSFAISLMWTEPGCTKCASRRRTKTGARATLCAWRCLWKTTFGVGGPTELGHLNFLPSVASDMVTVESCRATPKARLSAGRSRVKGACHVHPRAGPRDDGCVRLGFGAIPSPNP